MVAWSKLLTGKVNPPRVVYSGLSRGMVFGEPGDESGQARRLDAALNLLSQPTPARATAR